MKLTFDEEIGKLIVAAVDDGIYNVQDEMGGSGTQGLRVLMPMYMKKFVELYMMSQYGSICSINKTVLNTLEIRGVIVENGYDPEVVVYHERFPEMNLKPFKYQIDQVKKSV